MSHNAGIAGTIDIVHVGNIGVTGLVGRHPYEVILSKVDSVSTVFTGLAGIDLYYSLSLMLVQWQYSPVAVTLTGVGHMPQAVKVSPPLTQNNVYTR